MIESIFAASIPIGKAAPQIPPEVKSLFSALQLSEPDETPIKILSDREWTSLLDFCKFANLTLPVALLPNDGLPNWVVERFKTNLADNALRFELVKATYREVAEALGLAGIEHIVIKGFTQSPDYVVDPRFRAQNDIDIFCPPESIEAAYDALTAIGYEQVSADVDYTMSDHKPTLTRNGSWQWRGNSFDPEMPLSIELHHCLWNERVSQIEIPEVELFWNRRTTREVDGHSFPCLIPSDHLAYLTLHILRNLFLGEWIVHHVRELATFLHSHADDDPFWECWKQINSPSLGSFAAIAFYLARSWYGCRLHSIAALDIDRLPAARKSWLQCFSGSVLKTMFEKNHDALWLQLTYLSSPSAKWTILMRSFIPTRISPKGSLAVQIRNKRPVPSVGRPLWQQYIAYLISRSAGYIRADSATLWRGLCWRLSGRLLTR